ncbi:hypothetical protein FRC17_000927 [Serendipita sp. 399]|nr:hypothetical protein FRC17_000927 [Serendipita sp. 399]
MATNRKDLLSSILNIAVSGREVIANKVVSPASSPSASSAPQRCRAPVQPPVDLLKITPVLQTIKKLGVPESSAREMAIAYRAGGKDAIARTKAELKAFWLKVTNQNANNLEEATIKYTAFAEAIRQRLDAALNERYDLFISIVREHLGPPQSRPKWDKRWVPLFVWIFTSPQGFGKYPNRLQKQVLADRTQLSYSQISVWFQNRRARTKKAAAREEDEPPESPLAGSDWTESLTEDIERSALKKIFHRRHGDQPSIQDLQEIKVREKMKRGEIPNVLDSGTPLHSFLNLMGPEIWDLSTFDTVDLPDGPQEYREDDTQDDDSDSDEDEGRPLPTEEGGDEDEDIESFLVDDGYLPSYLEMDEEAVRDEIRKGNIRNALDDMKVPSHSFPTPMGPRIWELSTFEPTSWPRHPSSLDPGEPVEEAEVQTLAKQIFEIQVIPPPEEESILQLNQLCWNLNIDQQPSPPNSGNDIPRGAQATTPVPSLPSSSHNAIQQQPSRRIRFGIGKGRLIRKTLKKHDTSNPSQMLPPPTIPQRRRVNPSKLAVVKNITTGRQGRRRAKNLPAFRELPCSINSILQDLKRSDDKASTTGSDRSSSGSSHVESDEDDGSQCSDEPSANMEFFDGYELPECFKMTFSSRIAEDALQETLSQLGISGRTLDSSPAFDEYYQCFDNEEDADLAAMADRLPTGPGGATDVWEYNKLLTDNFYAPSATIKDFFEESIRPIAHAVVSPFPPKSESQADATQLASAEGQASGIHPSAQHPDDYTQYLTFEHHEEPTDYIPLPSILDQTGTTSAATNQPVPAILINSEPTPVLPTETTVAVHRSQPANQAIPANPQARPHLPPQPLSGSDGTEDTFEEPQALLGRLFTLLTSIPRSVWDRLGITQGSANEPKPTQIPFDPEFMFEIPDLPDDIDSIIPPQQLPPDIYSEIFDPHAVTDDGATIPALW